MNIEQRAALRKLAEEATPGPWYQVGLPWNQNGDFVCAGSEDPHIGKYVADTEDFDGEVENSFENAGYIAAANPQAIISLLDYIETLEKDAGRYQYLRSRDPRKDPCDQCGYDGLHLSTGHLLDCHIDDAMGETK